MIRKYDPELAITPLQNLNSEEDIINKITMGVDNWFSYFNKNLENWSNDSNFALGGQWDVSDVGEYFMRQKVLLTTNVLYSYILNIVGEQRQNSPQIAVRAKNKDIQQSTINLMEGILREISYSSNADLAYQVAFMNALMGGFGAWRIIVDYENPLSFNKVIKIVPSFDPLKHYFDINATDPTKCDGECAGTYSRISREEFNILYPDIELPESITPPDPRMRFDFVWYDKDSVSMCEDFHKIYKKTKLYKLSNGESVEKDKLDKRMRELKEMREKFEAKVLNMYSSLTMQGLNVPVPPPIENIKIIDERDTEIVTIRQTKFIKNHILEEAEWYGNELPIIFVDGDSHYNNGVQETRSFISYSKDAQKFLNFCVSEIAQTIKASNKSQFMFTPEQIKGYELIWSNPEKSTVGLPFNPDARVQGNIPIRLNPPEVSNSLFTSLQSTLGMIDNTLGRYEANKGQQGNEQSGKAVDNRAREGSKSVFIFKDNLNKAIEQSNKLCLGIIPEVYGEDERTIFITDREGKHISERINDRDEMKLKSDSMDVIVTIGPSFEVQKMDAFNQMLQLVNLNPQQFSTLLADLMAENLSLDNTNQIVERMRNYVVPPQVIAKENGEPPPKPQPNPQMEIAQMQAKAEMLKSVADVEKATNDIKTSQMKAEAEIEKARIGLATDIVKAFGDIKAQQLQSDNDKLTSDNKSLAEMLNNVSQFISSELH